MHALLAIVAFAGTSFAIPSANSKLAARDACSPMPAGAGPVPSPDTASNFLNGQVPRNAGYSGGPPSGYSTAFYDEKAAISGPNYQGYTMLSTFDPSACAALCAQSAACFGFNIFMERAPSVDPDPQQCPNPPSYTYYKCSLWGTPVYKTQLTNKGQMRANFQVVITMSIGYNKYDPTAQSGVVGGWDYTRQGANTTVNASPGSGVSISVRGTDPVMGGTAVADVSWLPSGDLLFQAQPPGRVSACTSYLNGGNLANGGGLRYYTRERRLNFTVECRPQANPYLEATQALTQIEYYRYKDGGGLEFVARI